MADLVASRPLALRVLERHHISAHRGAHRYLSRACVEAGVSREALLAEVATLEAEGGPDWDWSKSSLETIIAVIVESWHRPLEEALPSLQTLAAELARTYPRAPFVELAGVVTALHDEIGPHMLYEECVLFPMILDGHGDLSLARALHAENQEGYLDELLTRIRNLTSEFELPHDASRLQRRLWDGLATLARELTEHLVVESDVLVPRALGGEDPRRVPH